MAWHSFGFSALSSRAPFGGLPEAFGIDRLDRYHRRKLKPARPTPLLVATVGGQLLDGSEFHPAGCLFLDHEQLVMEQHYVTTTGFVGAHFRAPFGQPTRPV